MYYLMDIAYICHQHKCYIDYGSEEYTLRNN